ncbi:glutamine amidotransferase [Georgenia sp. 10Sc9-8]|uniref:Glutamine amidotransferase n=1 Tax=Georgenia halotolerans TaxID=3028317 RepID=A0ABT5U119_9MICO|nr:glutamine amidotransferase [Georgenia halotolerans]
MKPFLLLASRPEDAAADAEYAAFLRCTGLRADELHRVRMEAAPIPAVDLDQYSGIMVGGSPFTGSTPTEYKSDTQRRVEAELAGLLDEVVDADFPFLGACYGVGTLARHQGAVVDGTYAEPISAPVVEVTDDGSTDPLLAGLPRRFQAFVGHKEACTLLPDHAVLLITSASAPVQMFRVKENLYGTQFHPELDLPGILQRIAIYHDAGYYDPAQRDEVERQVAEARVGEVQQILANFVHRYATED